jgi:1-acyl-sn-glycerol-3-phosphate acyltransferase
VTAKEREREPLISLLVYSFINWIFVSPLLYTYFRARIYGVEKIPKTGSYLIVSNHASDCDPPFLAVSMRRPVSFMAKEELFRVPFLKQIITWCGAYPVNRASADRSAIRNAINSINNGWLAGIFLDGTRTSDGRIHSPKQGAALIAAKTQVQLIPVSVWGTDKIFVKGSALPRSVPVTIRVGDPIAPPISTKKEDLENVTRQCSDVIHRLHDLGR